MSRARLFAGACLLACSAMAVPPGEITGTVMDSLTGKAIPHARVTATIWNDRSGQYGDVLVAVTGEDGHFRFSGLPKGEAEVSVEKAGYKAEVRSDHMRTRPDDLSVPLTFRLVPTAHLTVRVVDDSGSPV